MKLDLFETTTVKVGEIDLPSPSVIEKYIKPYLSDTKRDKWMLNEIMGALNDECIANGRWLTPGQEFAFDIWTEVLIGPHEWEEVTFGCITLEYENGELINADFMEYGDG